MQDTIRLGHIRGIPIGVNWSVLVIFALVAVGLGAGRFPTAHPGYDAAVYAVAGLVTAVLFFGSIFAHEVSHALLAQRRGIQVEGITLWLFGGVARFNTEATNPRDDLHVAAVGPLTSFAAGAVFAVVMGLLDVAGATDLVVGMAMWLAVINIVLAVFNLFPAAPLDGGRILRALLWRRHGNVARAADTAAGAGRIFGLVLIGLGIAEFAFGAGLPGIWFMLLGWFLLMAARAEQTHARLRHALAGMTVRDVMTPEPVTAPDWITAQDLLDDYVLAHRCSTFPVRGFNGEVTGVVPLRALKLVPASKRAETRIRDIACPMGKVPVVSPDDDIAEVIPRMGGGCTEGRTLVLDQDGELVGILSPTDVTRLSEYAELRASAPREPHVS